MDDAPSPHFAPSAFAPDRKSAPSLEPEDDRALEPRAPGPELEEGHSTFSPEDDRALAPDPAPDPGSDAAPVLSPSIAVDRAPALSRDQAAARLGCSPRSVGRLVESGHLTARRDERGRPWFAVDEVERLARERSRHARPDPGELAARAFARFAAGAGPRDLVVEERIPPDAAVELHGQWGALGGGIVIDSARAHRLADALGMSVLDLDVVERALLALRRVAGALRVPCSVCGREGYVREAREFGPTWRCAECDREAPAPVGRHGG